MMQTIQTNQTELVEVLTLQFKIFVFQKLIALTPYLYVNFLPPSSNRLAASLLGKAVESGASSMPAGRFAWFSSVIKKEIKSC
ncbi:MAG: hypothetical protein COV52_02260 [Gammaproteobacteria bacterium CG11_big_fil_rev_8_21_14_0_20_46_22]|nr:MAG: hypothetical protein COW05_01250 [Gammaproteobacteria bacterium CG12_big_fil_rev_8_21_14_0_65_46_12]PIR11756.1 MAG: hypothetical protein COV52_02260 [Gammaproteobacteria bacterium CG11_big_fil_rev_8_21_14_0_20_46_22]